MKKYIPALLIMASFSTFAQSHNQSTLQKSLSPWKPLAISESAGAIAITMNEDRITPEIYSAVIKMGVCTPLWFGDKKSAYLKNTKEISILNRNNHSGFVFENPKSSCEEAGKAKDGGGDIVISSNTHSY
ncbi:hypothetical protein [Pectobacterium carotovorum]|uniref:hypothetical protein n=1 Tax=Pectobacterium carotovorum TaxID=554 RepID=UPI00381B0305